MTETKTCPKCRGEMAKGTKDVFGDHFACTRRTQKKLEKQGVDRIQPYYCKNCGYVEFYKEKTKEHAHLLPGLTMEQ